MEQRVQAAIDFLINWLYTNVLTMETAAQWACVLVAYFLSLFALYGFERKLIQKVAETARGDRTRNIMRAVVDIGNVLAFVFIMLGCEVVFEIRGYNTRVIAAARDLAVAWIVIRLFTSTIANRSVARGIVLTIWSVAALSVFGLLDPITDFLGKIDFTVGGSSFNVLGIISGLALALVFLQLASLASHFFESRISRNAGLTPSMQVLLVKAVKVCLFTGAILFAMSSVGIDLTSLAIFSSALGVGIGFGLRTIISNYVSGLILLMDNSIKPGDTIQVGSVYGVVRGMHGRYASVLTRDGMEHLIPNELLVTGEVVNWTHSDSNVRLKIPVGIAYDSDVPKALELLEKAAEPVERVLKKPAPASRLVGFGDSSVDLQLRIWIGDSPRGVANVRSEVLLNVWKLFHEEDIEFPFPQREMLLKEGSRLAVSVEKAEGV
jgi:small-conductance mechanosensitive channel